MSTPTHQQQQQEGASPFDINVDFDQVARRREKYLKEQRAKEAGRNPDDLSDSHNDVDLPDPTQTHFNRFGVNAFLGRFAGGGKGDGADAEEVLYGGRKVVQWPYDDYHVVQQQYYVKIEELKNGKGSKGGSGSGESKDQQQETAVSQSLQRPQDPPDIPTAVMGLNLSDFEHKAEERAIGIVSTWLYDCGLVDELLTHGGLGKSSAGAVAAAALSSSSSTTTTTGSNGTSNDGGQEGGPNGTTASTLAEAEDEGGPSKMDKEVAKLKESSQRTLTLINARLNDGVAASGGEVQELVNAVNSTKDDLARLRELSAYISNSGDVEQRSQKFMLTRYPKLKKAINARRNLARCFRELDFYSEIPAKCEQLREHLHSAEWSEEEWSSLRAVCKEHVELEIFLVEAEAGMKKRIDDEEGGVADSKYNSRKSKKKSKKNRGAYTSGHIYEEVDNYLHKHVKDVWELGDEIKMRIMSGISSAFDLAMNNPAGMVALVEAIEVYETANEEYKTVHGEEAGSNQTLRFTDMRASALRQLYEDFEARGLEVFEEVNNMIEEQEFKSETDATAARFSAVLRACNHLTAQIVLVQNQMSPCFPPYWALETLWATCVAKVCSKEILEQIGGAEGHKLAGFTAVQMLDLVAWVETFRETIEELFPNISAHQPKLQNDKERPDLLMDGGKQINMQVAKDSLAAANNVLWTVHDLAKNDFLYRTREQTDEWLDNVYMAQHTKSHTSEGRLVTSLCEDVYSLAGVQLRTIQERVTRSSEALVQAVGFIFGKLYQKQIESRNNFLTEFEECCAAANDFIRMSEKCEELFGEVIAECRLSEVASEALDIQASTLLALYSGDAVFASQKIHLYVFEPIEEAIGDDLFGPEWLEATDNEMAMTLVRTIEDFMGDFETFLDELMVGKTLDALVTSTVIFYIKCLVKKSIAHANNNTSVWPEDQIRRGLERYSGDVQVMKEFFENLADSYPSLNRAIANEFEILDHIHEMMSIASGNSSSSERDFIIVLQKRIQNITLTKYLVGDLYHLLGPSGERTIYELVDSIEEELLAVAPDDEQAVDICLARQTVPGLRLDQELAKLFDKSPRTRPGLRRANAEAILNRFKQTWATIEDRVRNDES